MKINNNVLITSLVLSALSGGQAFTPSGRPTGKTTLTNGVAVSSASAPTAREREPDFFEEALQNFQIWGIQHPDNFLSKGILPLVSVVEGFLANTVNYIPSKRRAFGNNFCIGGEVLLGDFDVVERALTSPQQRVFRLGTTVLERAHFPVQGGRNVFLLALSDVGAGGDGTHAAFRAAIVDTVINDAALERQQDATAQKLVAQLAKDYQEMNTGVDGDFFSADDRGLKQFLIRYLHYCLFELDPTNEAQMALLTKLYYSTNVTAYWVKVINSLLSTFNVGGAKEWPELIDQAVEIYLESPPIKRFRENNPEYMKMTKYELATACLPLMGIAGQVGPLQLAKTAMGGLALPKYEGHESVADIQVTKYWDAMDLSDRQALENYITECGRLYNPVTASHRIATEAFTVNINGEDRTFPAGTIIAIPIIMSMLDESFWGPTTFEFDPNRKNLCPFSMIFNSVGDRSNGRMCPGKKITIEMIIDLLQVTGELRRAG